jgi:3-hydroxyacyl-CoA dehydrogenase
MGKTVVPCRDTPGFIANRIGTLWIQSALNHAHELRLTIEEADAVIGRPMGVPKTGVFGLLDLVGLDLMPHVAKSLLATLPEGDAYRALHREHDFVTRLISAGRTGEGRQGRLLHPRRRTPEATASSAPSTSGPARTARARRRCWRASSSARRTCASSWRTGPRRALCACGAARHAGLSRRRWCRRSRRPAAVDEAMRLGYNWKWGPFELTDRLGPGWLGAALRVAGRPVPPLLERLGDRPFYRVEEGRLQVFHPDGEYRDIARPEGVLLLQDIKRGRSRC